MSGSKMKQGAVIIITAAALITCVAGIFNGQDAGDGEFPFLVSVTVKDEHVCGGFIFNTRWIITAASCLFQVDILDVRIVAGEFVLNLINPTDEQRLTASNIVIHEDYNKNGTMDNNIALVEVARAFAFGPKVNFTLYNDLDETITSLQIMGWGAVEVGGPASLKLLKTQVTLPANCSSYGAEFSFNYMICSGNVADGSSPCQFDEGSPLIQSSSASKSWAVGIMSKNRVCDPARPDFLPTIYTRLTAYYSWIRYYAGVPPSSG